MCTITCALQCRTLSICKAEYNRFRFVISHTALRAKWWETWDGGIFSREIENGFTLWEGEALASLLLLPCGLTDKEEQCWSWEKDKGGVIPKIFVGLIPTLHCWVRAFGSSFFNADGDMTNDGTGCPAGSTVAITVLGGCALQMLAPGSFSAEFLVRGVFCVREMVLFILFFLARVVTVTSPSILHVSFILLLARNLAVLSSLWYHLGLTPDSLAPLSSSTSTLLCLSRHLT